MKVRCKSAWLLHFGAALLPPDPGSLSLLMATLLCCHTVRSGHLRSRCGALGDGPGAGEPVVELLTWLRTCTLATFAEDWTPIVWPTGGRFT